MNELNKDLRQGESLLWKSSPQPFRLLENRSGIIILGEWIITVVLAAWLLYVERNNANFGTGAKLLLAAVVLAVILSPIVEFYNLKRQRFYLTDQRAVLVTADNTMYYMDYDKIDDTLLLDHAAGGKCIAMGGEILSDVSRQLRWRACHPKTDLQNADNRGEAQEMVFYLPEDADKAIELMQEAGVTID